MQDINEIYPNAEVRVSRAQYSTLHVKRMVEEREELVINPDFQRNYVWSPKQKNELVESILMGIPIPAIYLFESKDGKKQVVDGQQRISSIISFLNNEFSLKGLRILRQFEGNRFRDLDGKMQGIFEDFQLYFYIIQPPTPERVKYDIFDRVNRGGTRLNSQEMRNALYRGRATDLVKRVTESSVFSSATDYSLSSKRLKNQTFALRAIAFYLYHSQSVNLVDPRGELILYRSDMDDYLAKIMVYLNETAPEYVIEDCYNSIVSSLERMFDILGRDACRFASPSNRKRPLNMSLFETLSFVFSKPEISEKSISACRIVNEFKKTYGNSIYFRSNSDSSEMYQWRYDMAVSLIDMILND